MPRRLSPLGKIGRRIDCFTAGIAAPQAATRNLVWRFPRPFVETLGGVIEVSSDEYGGTAFAVRLSVTAWLTCCLIGFHHRAEKPV
jgi:hypothetical protein